MKKVIVIGATGTIGKAVVAALDSSYEVIQATRNSAEYPIDISDEASIKALYEKVGSFDALIVTAGAVHFGLLKEMTEADWQIGLQNKLMGQINLVTHGLDYINPKGSFTLTSGILNTDPILYGVQAAMINSAVEGFVTGAAIELENNVRINCVSPTVLSESMDKYEAYFKGYLPRDAKDVAKAYIKSVEGLQTGKVYKVQ